MGMQDAMVDGRRVFQVDGVCRYLSKYISGSTWTLDLLAMLKGRRTWDRSNGGETRKPPSYLVDDVWSQHDLSRQVNGRSAWGINEGWTLESGKDDTYARWTRVSGVFGDKEGRPLGDEERAAVLEMRSKEEAEYKPAYRLSSISERAKRLDAFEIGLPAPPG
jgi:hypothetical protein